MQARWRRPRESRDDHNCPPFRLFLSDWRIPYLRVSPGDNAGCRKFWTPPGGRSGRRDGRCRGRAWLMHDRKIDLDRNERVRGMVCRHLRTPALGPKSLGRLAAVSRSNLYPLFEGTGAVAASFSGSSARGASRPVQLFHEGEPSRARTSLEEREPRASGVCRPLLGLRFRRGTLKIRPRSNEIVNGASSRRPVATLTRYG